MLGVDNKEELTGKYKKAKENSSIAHFLPGSVLFLCILIGKKVTEVNDKIKDYVLNFTHYEDIS